VFVYLYPQITRYISGDPVSLFTTLALLRIFKEKEVMRGLARTTKVSGPNQRAKNRHFEQSRAEQSRAEQSRAEQSRVKQSA